MTEKEIKDSLYKELCDNLLEGIQIISFDWRYLYINNAGCLHSRQSRNELIGNKMQDVYPGIETTDMFQQLKNCMENRISHMMENEFIYPDASSGWFQLSIEPVSDGILIMSIDISEKKNLEKQLFLSQKLEATGKLAGGIAHDFNNLLSIIMGSCDLIKLNLKEGDPVNARIHQIIRCSEHASLLTKQLLAFSRKQVLKPKILNINNILSNVEEMILRIIGEDVLLKKILSSEIGMIKADPGQIEQVIINIAINAKDAMRSGGILTIETSNVYLDETYSQLHISTKPGEYVLLAITDTGHGMDEATLERIFEPFFSTKEQGEGSGLGLATVYGIVKQSGGNIWCYSEPGKGASFKVYFPVVEQKHEAENKTIEKGSVKRNEIILVVEDQENIRDIACSVLEHAGFKVICASNGKDALNLCKKGEKSINLLYTDVIMPEMNGKQLAEEVQKIYPDIKVLYTSGYTDNSIVHYGVLDEGINFIQKPFNMELLIKKINEVLNS
ncbi:MAG: ATP-binding protein [bacterium]|nr:ATP-binding protein [bacterium]